MSRCLTVAEIEKIEALDRISRDREIIKLSEAILTAAKRSARLDEWLEGPVQRLIRDSRTGIDQILGAFVEGLHSALKEGPVRAPSVENKRAA